MNRILVIGGTSGIGESFVKRFHKMGKSVIVTGRREQKLKELQESLIGVDVYAMDIGNLRTLPSHVDTIFSRFPDVDTVWVNAGIQYSSDIKDVSTTTDEKVSEEIVVNVTAPMILARHFIPRLLKQSTETNFMITSSGLGFVPVGSLFPIYCPAKAAIHADPVGIRQALKGTNVNVLELVPPFVGGTELGAEHKDKVAKLTPMGLEEFTDDIFKVWDETQSKDLKEVVAGSAVNRVDAWRSSIGEILVNSGLGG